MTKPKMKRKEKQQQEVTASEKKNLVSSSGDDDSDVERNFALLTDKRGVIGRTREEESYFKGDEGEGSDSGDEDEEGLDDGYEEEENKEASVDEDGDSCDDGEEEGASGDEEQSDDGEEDWSSEASQGDEDVEDPEGACCSGEIRTKEDIRKELSNMSFEDIMKLQNKLGTKVYNEVAYGSKKSQENSKKKRLNKNRPMEISAKKPAPFLRQVVPTKKTTLRDPRFDDLSGEYKPEIFERTYKFINDIKHREKEIIQKQLKRTKTQGPRKEKLQFLLKRMENQERSRKNREQQRERELQLKRQQREQANQGTRPFFLKKSEKKKLQLAEKYQELKKSGKLENFLSKKRKRNAGKDRRKLPKQLQNKMAA